MAPLLSSNGRLERPADQMDDHDSNDTAGGPRREARHALDLDLPVLLLEPAVLELGDGVPLETPRDHWSLRDA